MKDEIWLKIKDYDNYMISNLGKVKSLDRLANSKNGNFKKIKGRVLKPQKIKGGYIVVRIGNEKYKTKYIHHLVAEAFMNYKPIKGFTIDHKNNNKEDNNLYNLQIITQRENNSKDRKRKSNYLGVCWDKSVNKFKSSIKINNKHIHLGYFYNQEDASICYQRKLKSLL